MLPDNIPAEIRGLKRWVVWKAQKDEGRDKVRKIPCSPLTSEAIGAVERWMEHWVTADEACAAAIERQFNGIGFVFKERENCVGVDFDDARDATTGSIDPVVSDWLRWFPSYTEVSPSGTGIHVIGKGHISRALTATALPNSKATVEIYSDGRYFTWTGQRLNEEGVNDIQTGLDKLLQQLAVKSKDEPTDRPMSKSTAQRVYKDYLHSLRSAIEGAGNATLNAAAFFAGRAFAAGVFDQTADDVQKEMLDIVTKEWAHPHSQHGARQTIQSGWSTGFAKPLIIKESEWPDIEQTIEEFNRDYYVVRNFGGKLRICWEEQNPTYTKGKHLLLGNQHPRDFEQFNRNKKIQVGENDDGTPIKKNKASVWLDSPIRREFDKVVFVPGRDLGSNIRNLWRGFAFEPKKGDCSLYLAHLRENICSNNDTEYHYLIKWMAYAVRHPNEQGHAAIVIKGQKGVGKNVAAEAFAALWGQHALIVSDSKRITNSFNAHLRALCVLIADEAFFAGDRSHEGTLKSLITGSEIPIESKGVDVVSVPNLLHIIILSNDSWVVPASTDERRYLALNCASSQRGSQKYFGAILRQLKDGGYAALLHHLMYEVDLDGFNVRNVPYTKELRVQMTESLRNVEKAWFDCLYTGDAPGRVQHNGTLQMRTTDFMNWAATKKYSNIKVQHVGNFLGKAVMGFSMSRSGNNGNRSRCWDIPELTTARSIWNEHMFEFLEWEGNESWQSIEVKG